MDKKELKPCPFCDGVAYFDKDDFGWNWIECSKCHASSEQKVSAMDDCKPLLAEKWNARPRITALEERVKFYENCLHKIGTAINQGESEEAYLIYESATTKGSE